jgi:carboxypeptidase C (cathepsin A)
MDKEAQAELYPNPADVPLIIWTNGGPGCSAMEGATTESGPLVLYRIKESYQLATGQLSDNPYGWNKQGHVLYVDQPR